MYQLVDKWFNAFLFNIKTIFNPINLIQFKQKSISNIYHESTFFFPKNILNLITNRIKKEKKKRGGKVQRVPEPFGFEIIKENIENLRSVYLFTYVIIRSE